MPKIATVIGARPQFIKAATVSRAISKHNRRSHIKDKIKELIIHTGQHYDENMSKIFFDQLQIPRPHYNLGIGSDSHARQTGRMLSGVEDTLIKVKPDLVLTYGDTNSTLAGALAAVKLHIPSAHVEAGLRSYNRTMPEEINRVVTDQISNILFCPTETAVANLRMEGMFNTQSSLSAEIDLDSKMVFNVGDVMFDSILFNEKIAADRSDILKRIGLSEMNSGRPEYCLATVHRAENTDNEQNLRNIFEALSEIVRMGLPVILPLHPRTRRRLGQPGVSSKWEHVSLGTCSKNSNSSNGAVTMIEPVGYLDMLWLEKNSKVILTDSGGVQKEAYLLGVPCITLRHETEWVETVQAGWNILTGPEMEKIVAAFSMALRREERGAPFGHSKDYTGSSNGGNSDRVFGDGKAAEKILNLVSKVIPRFN
ncbi:MAG: non-hydrolyzing UDP-N-acetylglucosamine 2-epimerase [Candidatus Hodarchaeota archaeon]